ncbi:MAG: c-type cytochrome [Candidatus Methylomirabilales bacterium]
MAATRWGTIALGLFLAFWSVFALLAKASEKQYALWGNARKGRQVFVEKGCGSCHAIRGVGPNLGPDLGRISAKPLTMTQMAGTMWNHAPVMRRLAEEKGISWKPFRGSEMRDLITFLYAIRLMDEPGDPRRGERLFVEKGCATCHSLKGKGGTIGPDLKNWNQYGSPILWAELMWAHAIKMEEKVREFGIRWPTFERNEMIDLIAYIRKEVTSASPPK